MELHQWPCAAGAALYGYGECEDVDCVRGWVWDEDQQVHVWGWKCPGGIGVELAEGNWNTYFDPFAWTGGYFAGTGQTGVDAVSADWIYCGHKWMCATPAGGCDEIKKECINSSWSGDPEFYMWSWNTESTSTG